MHGSSSQHDSLCCTRHLERMATTARILRLAAWWAMLVHREGHTEYAITVQTHLVTYCQSTWQPGGHCRARG